MAKLLFKLHNVPEDEAHEVRQLLAEHDFVTYETHAGFWGLGVSAIWLRDNEQLSEARAVLAQYQRTRTEQQREQAQEQESRGERRTLIGQLFAHPFRFLAMLLAIVVVLLVSLVPFLMLMV